MHHPGKKIAFGVDPTRAQAYSLRQARYDAIATDLDIIAARAAAENRRLQVLDVGCRNSVLYRHLAVREHFSQIDYFGSDYFDVSEADLRLYVEFYRADLLDAETSIPEEKFDIVICEQVLEHLPLLSHAIATLHKAAKPGGTVFIGVPIFPFGVHLLRRHLVPPIDKLMKRSRERGHVQAFSKSTFLKIVAQNAPLKLEAIRGFRIVSGGILRGLENYRWWWRFNRWLGVQVPGLCIEVQAIYRKPSQQQSERAG